MDLISLCPPEHGHHIFFLELKSGHERIRLFVYVAILRLQRPMFRFQRTVFMGHFLFFAVWAIRKEPADFHCQTRSHCVRVTVQMMDNDV